MDAKKSKCNHLSVSDILLLFILHLHWCCEAVSICICHRHIKLVLSFQKKYDDKIRISGRCISGTIFMRHPAITLAQKIEYDFVSS